MIAMGDGPVVHVLSVLSSKDVHMRVMGKCKVRCTLLPALPTSREPGGFGPPSEGTILSTERRKIFVTPAQ